MHIWKWLHALASVSYCIRSQIAFWKERSLNNHWKAVTHFSFFAISKNSVMANQGISLHLYKSPIYIASTLVIMRGLACRTQDWTKSSVFWALSGFWLIHANTYALESAAYFHFVVNVYFVIKVTLAACFFPESWTLLYIYTSSLNHPGDPFLSLTTHPSVATQGLKTPGIDNSYFNWK